MVYVCQCSCNVFITKRTLCCVRACVSVRVWYYIIPYSRWDTPREYFLEIHIIVLYANLLSAKRRHNINIDYTWIYRTVHTVDETICGHNTRHTHVRGCKLNQMSRLKSSNSASRSGRIVAWIMVKRWHFVCRRHIPDNAITICTYNILRDNSPTGVFLWWGPLLYLYSSIAMIITLVSHTLKFPDNAQLRR